MQIILDYYNYFADINIEIRKQQMKYCIRDENNNPLYAITSHPCPCNLAHKRERQAPVRDRARDYFNKGEYMSYEKELPTMNEHKSSALDALESDMQGLDVISVIEWREGLKFAIELVQEAITEQLPDDKEQLLDLIKKMEWSEKVSNYLDYKREEYLDDTNEYWDE